jgi:hypothetical protein
LLLALALGCTTLSPQVARAQTCQGRASTDTGITLTPALAAATVSGGVTSTTANRYTVSIGGNATYRFTFCSDGGSATYDTVLCLVDSALTAVASNDDFCGLGSQVTVALTPGTYFLVVSGFGAGSGSYTLAYLCLPPSCNGRTTVSTGVTLQPTTTPATVSGSVTPTTSPLYAVSVCDPGDYLFTFCSNSGTADYDTWLCFFDASGNLLAQNDDTCGLLSQLRLTLARGDYSIAVSGFSTSAGTYTLAYSTSETSPSPAAQIVVTFAGRVTTAGIGTITRGQSASGRLVYDNTVAGFPGSQDAPVPLVHNAILDFEVTVGSASYAMAGAPGQLSIYDVDPNTIAFGSAPRSLSGPAMAGFAPSSATISLQEGNASFIPSTSLSTVPTEYSLSDFAGSTEDMSLQFESADGEIAGGVLIDLTRLEAMPLPAPPPPRLHAIRLEDVVAGGDGSGNAPAANSGVDPRTGAFTTSYFAGQIVDTDGVNPSPVPTSPYIDSVFFLKPRIPTTQDSCDGCFRMHFTQSRFFDLTLADMDAGQSGFNFILKDRAGGVSEPGIRVGSRDTFTTAIGIHSSMGITFDLDALRARHGDAAVGCFSTFMGMDDCATGFVRLLVFTGSDETPGYFHEIRSGTFGPGQGDWVSIRISPGARYLTLLSAPQGSDNCDHGTFARPVITPVADPLPCAAPGEAWIWSLSPSRVAPGEAVLVRGEALLDFYGIRVGGVPLLDQEYLSDTLRRGTMPQLAPGVYDVTVVSDEGHDIFRLPQAVEVAPSPVVTAVMPERALFDRRTFAFVRGENLRPDMEVFVTHGGSNQRLGQQEFVSERLITGYLPPLSAPPEGLGPQSVLILDQGRCRVFPGLLTYAVIGLEKVEPNLVLTTGGTEVTFHGLGFTPGMSFRIGSQPLVDLQILDGAHARGKSPPFSLDGLYHADVVGADGQVIHTLPFAVQALSAPAPQITGIVPLTVSTRGGDIVSVFTDSWHGGATPTVGGLALVNVDATDPVLLRGEAPPLPAGLHAVELVALNGMVLDRIDGAIEAFEPPGISITSVAPFEVATGGGTPVTFTGTGFELGFVPRLGGLPLTAVEIEEQVDGQLLRGLSPALPEGPHAASITEGAAELARLDDAVEALPIELPMPPVLGRPAARRFAAGVDRIAIAAAGVPEAAVLRVGGTEVVEVAPSSPCGVVGGQGGGAGIAGDGGHAVFEGMVPNLPPGRYVVDFYLPGQGVVAMLEEAIEVVSADAPPAASHVVSAGVVRDGGTRLHIFGSGFGPQTTVRIGGRPLAGATVVSPRLIVGSAPALAAGEPLGPRTLELSDPRGGSSLAAAVVYVESPPPPEPRFVRGDANASGEVDLSDAVTILGYLFLGNPRSLACLDAANVDAGAEIDIADPIQLLGHLFLGAAPPVAPYPTCGNGVSTQGCERFAPCGGGGGAGIAGGGARGDGGGAGPVAGLRPNVHVLSETRAAPGDPIVRNLSPVSGEVIIDDPPGGLDLGPGDVIAGYVPVTSEAIHEGVTYLLMLQGSRPPSCLATAPADQTYGARTAALAEVFTDTDIAMGFPPAAADLRISSAAVVASGNTLCSIAEGAGGGAGAGAGAGQDGDGGGAGNFDPLIDVDFHGLTVFSWQDGPNFVHAGFHRLRVLYAASQASLGVGISGGGLTGASFFSGILLDSEIELYVDTHFEQHVLKETKLLTLRKDHIVVVYGVPIHFAATGDLYAGVDLNAQVNLYVDAGARASFRAGVGFRFDGERIHNLSGIDPPSLERIPDTPDLDLSGSVVAKGYVRPETHLFAGILFRGLTADLGTRAEAFVRFHAAGQTDPLPCFDWGIDAGMKVTLIPEIQLFGYDLFDRTFDVINFEELNILGDRYGCSFPPVALVSHRVVPLGGDRYEVFLDASASYDPDGGPLRFRWDFNDDGQCDRATLRDPRTSAVLENVCPPFRVTPFGGCLNGRAMRLRVTDDEDASVELAFSVVLR